MIECEAVLHRDLDVVPPLNRYLELSPSMGAAERMTAPVPMPAVSDR